MLLKISGNREHCPQKSHEQGTYNINSGAGNTQPGTGNMDLKTAQNRELRSQNSRELGTLGKLDDISALLYYSGAECY